MKKTMALFTALTLCVGLLAGCFGPAATGGSPAAPPSQGSVGIRVVTSYGGNDGNASNFRNAVSGWEMATGNTVIDESAVSDEAWKATVLADFETGSEPDVLFFFTGVDANPLVSAGMVVSLEEIRAEYPEYAGNMDDDKMSPSPVDGNLYAVPMNGYWEGLYCNLRVLEAAGVAVPDATTTWDEFIGMCQKVKDAGFTPIAVSINEIPHYWFEFCVLNNGQRANHEIVPAGPRDTLFQNWVAGLNDIKDLYSRGFFPVNTNTSSDDDTMRLMVDGQAAFAIDGSWKMGYFRDNAENIDDFTVTYVPGKNGRAPTDMIGGLSMGFYITRKGWEDETRRDAIVSFVRAMTTDNNVNMFADGVAVTALKTGTAPPADADSLGQAAVDMINGSTGTVSAVQDNLTSDAKQLLFPDNMKLVVTGEMPPEASIEQALALTHASHI